MKRSLRSETCSPLRVCAKFFEDVIFERQCAHAEPPPTPARAANGAHLVTNGRIRARLGRPRAATCRAGAPFFGLISILKIKYRKIHVRNKLGKMLKRSLRSETCSPLRVCAKFFEDVIFERQCAHAEPPPTPARAANGAHLVTNGRIRARLGRPRAATCRAGAPFFGLISILKIKYRKIHVRNKFLKSGEKKNLTKKRVEERMGGEIERGREREGDTERQRPRRPPRRPSRPPGQRPPPAAPARPARERESE